MDELDRTRKIYRPVFWFDYNKFSASRFHSHMPRVTSLNGSITDSLFSIIRPLHIRIRTRPWWEAKNGG